MPSCVKFKGLEFHRGLMCEKSSSPLVHLMMRKLFTTEILPVTPVVVFLQYIQNLAS